MVPLRDNNPIRITPYVNYGIIAVNIAVFIYQLSLSPQELQEFFCAAAVVPCQISNTCPQIPTQAVPEWLTLFTSQFLHGGFLHIAGFSHRDRQLYLQLKLAPLIVGLLLLLNPRYGKLGQPNAARCQLPAID